MMIAGVLLFSILIIYSVGSCGILGGLYRGPIISESYFNLISMASVSFIEFSICLY